MGPIEVIAGAAGVLLLLWICSGNNAPKAKYSISETDDKRYCEVVENETGKVEFVGTRKACENWIEEHR